MLLAFIKMNVRPEKRKELLQTFQSIVFQDPGSASGP
jgi:hypothetical protein